MEDGRSEGTMALMEVVAVRKSAHTFALPSLSSRERVAALIEIGGVMLRPVFAPATNRPGTLSLPSTSRLDRYLRVEVERATALEIAAALRARDDIETAYVKPLPLLPIAPRETALELATPQIDRPIPDLSDGQGYRLSAPNGVDVQAAWALLGGMGDGVRIIDIEGGWCLEHVDLEGNGGLSGGEAYPEFEWRNHGTAVLGIMIAENDASGVRGLAPNAQGSAYTHRSFGAAGAIQRAADLLSAGDILLLEMHSPGPRHDYELRDDQKGYIAVEWWPDTFDAIRYAIDRGIIVVEAAGNGAESLDDELYETPDYYFPEGWQNPFRQRDSGAILVGAGAPANALGTLPRSRLDFSNFGDRVDCQGWGGGVWSTGYGDLYVGAGEHQWFTDTFSGTSSASPIVAGALACVQGVARARGTPLNPQRARQMVRDHGTDQQGPAERIGKLPDLAKLIAAL
jgi:subtilisin family serine protease